MTAVVYAHKAGRGNGVGLHYSRFRPSWRFIIPPNQRLGLMLPAQNRHFPPRIREVGLNRVQFETRSTNLPRSPRGGEDLNWNLRVSNWTRFRSTKAETLWDRNTLVSNPPCNRL